MVMKIPLTQGKTALVDDEDYPLISKYKWHAVKRGNQPNQWYAVTCQIGRNTKMHHIVMGVKRCDHIDGDGLNNTHANLREATTLQNSWNRRKPRQLSRGQETSKYKGVSKQTLSPTWCCRVVHNYKTYYIGSFKTEHEAAIAYDKWAIGLFGEYAKTNFPIENYHEVSK